VRIIMLCYHSMPQLIDGRGSPDRSDHSRGLIVLPCGCSLSRAAAVCAPGDVMPYFYLQHDDYVALKSRVASAVLAGICLTLRCGHCVRWWSYARGCGHASDGDRDVESGGEAHVLAPGTAVLNHLLMPRLSTLPD
jgi:hypothetical protein